MNINKLKHYAFGLAILTSVTWADRAYYDSARDLAINADKALSDRGTDVYTLINDRKGVFFDPDTKNYVFVINADDKVIANGGSKDSIGKDVNDITIDDGRTLADRIDDIKKTAEGQGWACYSWEPADSDQTMSKHSYLIYNKKYDVLVGSGAYQQ